jgi:hypothetical protein
MDMIVKSTDLQGGHSMFSSDAADICPDSLLNVGGEIREAIFGAEYQVIVERTIGVGHWPDLKNFTRPDGTQPSHHDESGRKRPA